MNEQIDILIKLQKIETETSRISVILKSVSEKADELDTKLSVSEQTLEAESSLLDELRKKYRSYEADVKDNIFNIEKNQENLRSIKTNEGYQLLLRTIDDLKAKNSKFEDEMIACLNQTEEAEKSIASKKDEYLQLKDQTAVEKHTIKQKSAREKKKLAKLHTEWRTFSERMDPRLLKKINMVKEMTGRSAIARVKDAICEGCNMNIPPQMYNDLQRLDKLESCPYCQRIIYWEKPSN